MRGRKNGEVPPRLLRAASRFAEWRRTRALGARIPKSLWTLAAHLGATYGVCRTAGMLRLNYCTLRKRVEAKGSRAGLSCVPDEIPAFVELGASTLTTAAECVIELENAAGSRMRVHLKGVNNPDLVTLSGSLWNAQR